MCFEVIIIITNKDTGIINKYYNIRKFTELWQKSFIYMLKSMGPQSHHWGTPCLIDTQHEEQF